MFNDLCNIVSFLPCKNSAIDSGTTLLRKTHLSYYNVASTQKRKKECFVSNHIIILCDINKGACWINVTFFMFLGMKYSVFGG